MSRSKAVMGIDPGGSGGLAVVSLDGDEARAHRYPGDTSGCFSIVSDYLIDFDVRLCVLEKVHSMPGQGVSSTFKFGWNVGAWEGLLVAMGVPYLLKTPQSWQAAMFDSRGKDIDKKARSLDLARRLFPQVDLKHKADDGKAEALLMARYAKTLL